MPPCLGYVNSAPMNTGAHAYFQMMVFSDIYPGVGLQDHMVALFLVLFFFFNSTSILFSIVAVPIYMISLISGIEKTWYK